MSNRLIAIGDIHGCLEPLDMLLRAISPVQGDTIVTLGDYVDRGPDSKGVVDRLIELKSQCELIALQGNHEEMMLDVVKGKKPHFRWLQYGGVQTLDSYGFIGDLNIIPEDHHAFFDSMVDYYESEDHLFFHANYDADKEASNQDVYALRWRKLTESAPQPHLSGKRAIVGHTHDPTGEILDLGHIVCLDTYCYGGGWLTAFDTQSGKVWQASMDGRERVFEPSPPA